MDRCVLFAYYSHVIIQLCFGVTGPHDMKAFEEMEFIF